jgi:Tol biopolymer transport system component
MKSIKLLSTILLATIILNNNSFSQTGALDGSGGGIIAFISDRDGTNEIYLMNADGSYQTQVTNNNAFNFGLDWSQDGARLVFCSTLSGGFEIFIMDVIDITTASFTEPVRITNNTIMEFSPSWSPDGSSIAFDSQWNGNPSIVVMNLANGNITPLNTSPVNGSQPSWSPPGDRIAFASMQGIYTITTSSTDLQQLTFVYSVVPEYSPDGTQIAYVATEAAEDIFIINSDGTGNYRITTSAENDFVPSWSPDGNRLVYEGTVSGIDQICVIDTNGTDYQQLTRVGVNTGPAWYPITDPTSITKNENIPSEFKLFQNYPNPFNPVTNIEFSIPKTEFVTLKIYNILGEEVITLVSKKLSAGKYKYDLDARKLSTGIYFYQLHAGDFIEIKKMILMQ